MDFFIMNKDALPSLAEQLIAAVKQVLTTEKPERLFTNKEACSYLKVCSKTLQNYRDDGLLAFSQVGRKIYYKEQDLNNFLEKYKKQIFSLKIKKYETNFTKIN